jgi:hypothetical protein
MLEPVVQIVQAPEIVTKEAGLPLNGIKRQSAQPELKRRLAGYREVARVRRIVIYQAFQTSSATPARNPASASYSRFLK